jgi:hypothetical protein
MLGVRPDKGLARRLSRLAKKAARSKSHYAREGIRQHLEDREDYLFGLAVLGRKLALKSWSGALAWRGEDRNFNFCAATLGRDVGAVKHRDGISRQSQT